MPRGTWGQCYDSLLQIKISYPIAGSQVSSGFGGSCFTENRARAVPSVPAVHGGGRGGGGAALVFRLPSSMFSFLGGASGHPKVSWSWSQEFMVMILRCRESVTSLYHLWLTHDPAVSSWRSQSRGPLRLESVPL